MVKHLKSFALLLTVCLGFVSYPADAGTVILKYRIVLGSTETDVGCLVKWEVEQQVEETGGGPDDRVRRYWEPCVGCDCQVYRDGILIATVQSGEELTFYRDRDVVVGRTYEYQIGAMGELSNKRELT